MTGTALDSAHQLSLFEDLSAVPSTDTPPQGTPTPSTSSPASRSDNSRNQLPGKNQGSHRPHERRIFHLEQALDQALACLNELDMRVKDQYILEEKLAATEDYAFVQYQVIARFKEQFSQYKDTLGQTHQTIAGLEAEKTAIQTKLLVLQQDRQALRQENVQWKHACQELQQECDRQHRKISALEQENTAMQEQILQQACQSNEYETAVQYWQEQCRVMREHIQSMLAAIENQLTDPRQDYQLDIVNLYQIIQSYSTQLPQAEPPNDLKTQTSSSMPVFDAFIIPDFLIRRHQNRSKNGS